jgi:hypothetical protein
MNLKKFIFGFITIMCCLLSGCAILEVAVVGAGKSATIEDTGFLKTYAGLTSASDEAHRGLPDLYYISPKIKMDGYK